MDKLNKAKAQLVLDQPFFGTLLLHMPMQVDESIPTFATNGSEIRFNPAFLDKLTLPETVFVLAHETMHCVFQHMHRRGDRSPNRWNQAADYVINQSLVDERIGIMPPGGLFNPDLVRQGNGTTEGVYALIPESDESKGSGDDGGAMDTVEDAAGDPAEMQAKESEMRVRIVQAANAAKMCGKLSGGIERLVKEFTKSKVNWRAVLRQFLTERAKTDLSYARPKRRFIADDLNLPSLQGEKLGSVVVAVDCSGSIDAATLERFSAEINGIKEDTQPANVHVLYFDTEILKHDTFNPDECLDVKPVGGGGTAFSPIFKYIEEKDLNSVAVVVLTDLCCGDYGDTPVYPVLWACVESYGFTPDSPPFGDVMPVKE